jgi:hypothetical protein
MVPVPVHYGIKHHQKHREKLVSHNNISCKTDVKITPSKPSKPRKKGIVEVSRTVYLRSFFDQGEYLTESANCCFGAFNPNFVP